MSEHPLVQKWKDDMVGDVWIEQAVKLAENWIESYAKFLAPQDPDSVKTLLRDRGYEIADTWINEMTEKRRGDTWVSRTP